MTRDPGSARPSTRGHQSHMMTSCFGWWLSKRSQRWLHFDLCRREGRRGGVCRREPPSTCRPAGRQRPSLPLLRLNAERLTCNFVSTFRREDSYQAHHGGARRKRTFPLDFVFHNLSPSSSSSEPPLVDDTPDAPTSASGRTALRHYCTLCPDASRSQV